MGLAGREKVTRNYDWERKIDQILRIYAETAHGDAALAGAISPS